MIQVDRETSPNRDEVKKTQQESCHVLVGDEPVEHACRTVGAIRSIGSMWIRISVAA